MTKTNNIRVKDLASELNISTQEIIDLKKKVDIKHKNIIFTLEEVEKIRIEFKKNHKVANTTQKEIEKMTKDLNIIYYGPAGTGKTREAILKVEEFTGENYKITSKEQDEEIAELENRLNFLKNKKRPTKAEKEDISEIPKEIKKLEAYPLVEFTTFHPSYQYQEFIEGITIKEENKKTVYEIKDGIFKKIAQRALDNPAENYTLIIDEINRGNISSIFGEFFTLLENTKRVSSTDNENPESVAITLPYSQEKLSVPDNLYIIGTMNTTDKSISLLDVALRRRFKFILVEPKYDILKNIETLDTSNMLKTINKRLSILKGEDFQIGHSYFIEATTVEDLREIFEYKIIPLLKEYFHGDWESVCAVLNQDYEAINDKGLLIHKFTPDETLFSKNKRIKDKMNKKKVCQLNSNFTIDDLIKVI